LETGVCLRHSFLPDDGDRLQSPKRRVFFVKDRRWIMSKKFVISKTHYRHKSSEIKLGCEGVSAQ